VPLAQTWTRTDVTDIVKFDKYVTSNTIDKYFYIDDVITLRAKLRSVLQSPISVCVFVCGSALLQQPARSVCVASERFFISTV